MKNTSLPLGSPGLDADVKANWCDAKEFFAWKMIHSDRSGHQDSVQHYFERFKNELPESETNSELALQVYHKFAILQLSVNEPLAKFYFNRVINNTSDNSIINLIARIQISSTSNILDEQVKLKAEALKRITEGSDADNKAMIAIHLMRISTPEEVTNIIDKFLEIYNEINDDELRFSYLVHTINKIAISEISRLPKNLDLELQSAQEKSAIKGLLSSYYYAQAQLSIVKRDYIKAFELARNAIGEFVGNTTDNSIILDSIRSKPLLLRDEILLSAYAKTNLYLTRTGKGIESVKNAFSIYEAIYLKRISEKISETYNLQSTGRGFGIQNYVNLLIIGNYLYEKTGDVSYLNRSLTVIDRATGGSAESWITKRAIMRENEGYARAIEEEQGIAKQLSAYGQRSVVELQELSRKWKAISSANHKTVAEEYERLLPVGIYLESMQEESRKDSSGLIYFLSSSAVLYRVFVSADTIDVSILNHLKTEAEAAAAMIPTLVLADERADELATTSRQVYQLLFQGIDSLLPPRLMIIANGPLEQLPYTLLRMDREGASARYLGVEHAISRQFSLRTRQLLEEIPTSPKKEGILGFAPSFGNELLEAGELRQAGFTLPPLLYNQEELQLLANLGKGQFRYADRATLETYRAEATEYSIIHLSTHAISSQLDGLRSRIYLLTEDGEPTTLFARDIGDQTLNADLVTLSACETGTGGVNYVEGTIGLTKAYIAAGARSVVASNWAVDDYATAELMQYFYQELRNRNSQDVALQRARQHYLEVHPGAHPAQWAAFEVNGALLPPRWREKGGWPEEIWLYLLLFVGILVGGAAYKKYRHA